MNTFKRILMVGLGAALVFSCAACSMVAVNKDRDASQAVADVNGTKITKGEVNEAVDSMLSMYGMTQETYSSSYGAEQLTTMKSSMLDSMIDQEMLFQKAKEAGLVDESDEHKAEIKAQLEEDVQSLKDSIRSQVEADDTVAQEDKESTIEEQSKQFLTAYGYDDLDAVVENRIKNDATTAMQDQVKAEVTYTEDEAKTFYDEQVTEQQEAIAKDPTSYATYNSSSVAVVRPDDAKYIKNLLLMIPDDVQTEIKTLRADGDDAGADVKRDEALAEIKAKADEVLARVNAGEDFDALIEEVGEDTGMKQEPNKTNGYLVYQGVNMADDFISAALALANEGDVSGLVATDFGYHILKNVKNAGGVIPFDEIKDTIVEKKLSETQSAHLTDTLTQWKDAANITVDVSKLSE
ncbi:MAG: peptidylprolyl isomerase [Christensenella sp.]|nr:peptidylprolyl isomerase [Christensenella sp.]